MHFGAPMTRGFLPLVTLARLTSQSSACVRRRWPGDRTRASRLSRQTSYLRGDWTHVRGDWTHLRGDSTYVAGWCRTTIVRPRTAGGVRPRTAGVRPGTAGGVRALVKFPHATAKEFRWGSFSHSHRLRLERTAVRADARRLSDPAATAQLVRGRRGPAQREPIV